jgi:hypothetical protein
MVLAHVWIVQCSERHALCECVCVCVCAAHATGARRVGWAAREIYAWRVGGSVWWGVASIPPSLHSAATHPPAHKLPVATHPYPFLPRQLLVLRL